VIARQANQVPVGDVAVSQLSCQLFAEHLQEMALVTHDQAVEALAAQRPDNSLRHSVRVGGSAGVTIVVIPMRAACCMKSVP
jgi:hypothetical protein